MRNHVESKHFPNQFEYHCNYCEKICNTKKGLDVHISERHRHANLFLGIVNSLRWQNYAGKIKSISGSGGISLFLNSNLCLVITLSVFKKQKWFCTFYNDMAFEKMNLCFDNR